MNWFAVFIRGIVKGRVGQIPGNPKEYFWEVIGRMPVALRYVTEAVIVGAAPTDARQQDGPKSGPNKSSNETRNMNKNTSSADPSSTADASAREELDKPPLHAGTRVESAAKCAMHSLSSCPGAL